MENNNLTGARRRYFGTDGIRGIANQGPLAMDQVLKLGQATAAFLQHHTELPAVVGLGWDTRTSSPALAQALAAGLAAGGIRVRQFGVLPTPAIARLVIAEGLALGLVISASHNPAEDNGIKYFSSQGGKLPDAWEAELEYWLETQEGFASRSGCEVGCVAEEHEFGRQRYHAMLEQQFRRADFAGQAVILDLAHGALTRIAPEIFAALGCHVQVMNNAPDGKNINLHCGSCHLEGLIEKVKAAAGAAIGMAFDGDGDRVMLVDEQGQVVNGDRVLGLLAREYHQRGALPGAGVAATVMSNLGLEKYLESLGIRMLRTAVGDRYVAEAMAEQGLVLGGEQSGHILLPRLTPTGDGLLTALEVLRTIRCLGATLHELTAVWQDYPQILINVPVSSRPELLGLPEVARAHQAGCAALGSQGRINLRYSGTENLARVMVEARDQETCRHWAGQIADAVQKSIGSGQARKATWLTCA